MPVLRAAKSAEELALLRTVAADLSDDAALAVYCDWLEEHADPRGDFLRRFLRNFEKKRRLPSVPTTFPPAWADVLALPVRRRLRGGIDARDPEMRAYLKGVHPKGFAAYQPIFGEVLRALHPSVRLVAGEPTPLADLPVRATRAGGWPDLPAGMGWPGRDAGARPEGWPIRFLLQIDLADVGGTLADGFLPASGLLSLFQVISGFHGLMTRGVFYFPPGTDLRRFEPPPPGSEIFPPMDVARPLTLADSLRFDQMLATPGAGEPLPVYLTDGYFDMHARQNWFCSPWAARIRAGWMAEGLEELIPTTHLKLFDLPYDDDLGWAFGDGGRYHVYATPEDARAGRFDAAICYEV